MQTGWLDPARKPFWLTKMKTGIGIDVGTFHTVAVSSGSLIRIPNQSIPSRALRAGPVLIVGIDTISQLNSSFERILAPKLMLDDSNKKNTDLKEVIQKLKCTCIGQVAFIIKLFWCQTHHKFVTSKDMSTKTRCAQNALEASLRTRRTLRHW